VSRSVSSRPLPAQAADLLLALGDQPAAGRLQWWRCSEGTPAGVLFTFMRAQHPRVLGPG
jgi:hypothetical protein